MNYASPKLEKWNGQIKTINILEKEMIGSLYVEVVIGGTILKTIDKKKQGKTSRAHGMEFENRVRKNLEEQGWIVDKWSNNVEDGKLIPAKTAYAFNPRLKMRVPLTRSTGFPDFIAFRPYKDFQINEEYKYEVIGVESKMTGELDRAEKEKCVWLLENKIFSKILIAKKTKVKNKIVIVYEDFKIKYYRFYK